MNGAHLELHIEELILEGFSPADRYRIADALERELSALLAAAPVAFERGERVAALDGGACEIEAGAAPQTIGAQIARTLHGGLSR
jgi:hypothetical protein